jgi:DNA-binding response OmpR family regulator
LVVLDLNLPGLDGLSLLKSLRQKKANLPVMILAARSRDSGANDCLVKPVSYLELSALPRLAAAQPSALRVHPYRT